MMHPEKWGIDPEELEKEIARLTAKNRAWLKDKKPSRAWLIERCATLEAIHLMHLKNTANMGTVMVCSAREIAETVPLVEAIEQENSANKQARRKGADAKHKENRACKAYAFAWLDANFSTYNNMDVAAEVMAGKIVPYKFRAVRDWVTEWKKLRSASTP